MTIVANFEDNCGQTTVVNHTCIIPVPEKFTVVQAVPFKQEFLDTLKANSNLASIILDLSATMFMDSSGIGALVACHKVAKSQDLHLILRRVSPQVMQILELAALESLFTIEPEPVAWPGPETPGSDKPFITHPSVQSRAKRALDITGAIVGLSVTALLFPAIALAIKIESPNGPIFYSQTRCSWMGKHFRMWKFRSMIPQAEQLKSKLVNEADGPIFKQKNDPRITRVGRFLRRTSLDELPQFWNVLTGEMSLVGTRPPTPDEVERYEIPHWSRLDIKPGITGEWQVNGRSNITNFQQVVELDLRYQENWSLKYDLQILIKTVLVLFCKNAGAY